jgi:uncharacterized oxidoreductase
MQMTGNTMLITGGGSGIGRALAESFLKHGNKVVIAGRRQDVLDETTTANPGMASVQFDIDEAANIPLFARKMKADYPALNVLISNAGIMRFEDLVNRPDDVSAAEAIITTNLLGTIRLTSALLPQLLHQSQSTIITLGSGLAFVPLAPAPAYCATKAALHAWTQSLRYQLRDTTTRVIELIPPYVQTEIMGRQSASDHHAMPLTEFIAEVMHILQTEPEAAEVCVEGVKPQRFAAEGGRASYDVFFQNYNDMIAESYK